MFLIDREVMIIVSYYYHIPCLPPIGYLEIVPANYILTIFVYSYMTAACGGSDKLVLKLEVDVHSYLTAGTQVHSIRSALHNRGS